MLNLLLLTSAAILAYLLAYFFNYLDKVRYRQNLNRFKAKKVMLSAKQLSQLFIDNGYSPEQAYNEAIAYISEITNKGY